MTRFPERTTVLMSDRNYPWARRSNTVEMLNRIPISDPYRWLEDAESQDSIEWMQKQDELLTANRDTWYSRDWFHRQLEDLAAAGTQVAPAISPPVWRGDRQFVTMRSPSQQLPVLAVIEPDGEQRILVDPIALDPTGQTLLDVWRPSPDGSMVAYQVSMGTTEQAQLSVVATDTCLLIDETMARTRFSPLAWTSDSTAFYYVADGVDPQEASAGRRSQRVRLHRVGEPTDSDREIFGKEWPGCALTVRVSPCGRWLVLSAMPGADSTRNALYIGDLSSAVKPGEPTLRLIHDGADQDGQSSVVFGLCDDLFVVTNRDAPQGRVCRIDPDQPQPMRWLEVHAALDDSTLRACVAIRRSPHEDAALLVQRCRQGVDTLTVHDRHDGHQLQAIPLPGTGTISRLTTHPGDGSRVWFTYTDFTTPPSVYCYDYRTGHVSPWPFSSPTRAPHPQKFPTRRIRADQQADIGDAGRPPLTQRVSFQADDGVTINMFISGHNIEQRCPRPTLLTAYGGFGASMSSAYSPIALAWVRAGGIYAVACIRGGGESGSAWHIAGRGRSKPRVFADFRDAARWLIDRNLTTPQQLAIRGMSNGGLLVAVAAVQHPELYAAVSCESPLADMIRYEHFGLGSQFCGEFGTAADAEDFACLYSYSPYHQVRKGIPYPALLVSTPAQDPRTDSMHARKFTAALQHATSSQSPVLLRVEHGVGHALRTKTQWIQLHSDALAFLSAHTGLQPPSIGSGSGIPRE
ncbi:S9 family peptidase [Nocardia colli]|uniref:prolyl oligopeptidase n=1 Tax=Nocardia colli TaxID=2545717 RepID=A0A5N0DW92_9NOCA|nr:prolyl oligopeptidase family serine peptidase [Nocardia colli]KAA8880620.1 S9 family peptidase [Nocardia colli]